MKYLNQLKHTTIKYFPDGIINFLLITGSFCGFLSAFNIGYHGILVYPLLLIFSIVFAILYHCVPLQRIIMYTLLFVIYFAGLVKYGIYINAGFYIIINKIQESFGMFLNISTYQEYMTLVDAEYEAVSLCVLFISVLFLLMVNVIVTDKKRILAGIITTLPLLCIPLYVHAEPSILWQAALISGYLLLLFGKYIQHKEGHYSIKRLCLSKLIFSGILYIVTLFFLILINLVFPLHVYNKTYEENTYKVNGYETVSNFIRFGFSGLFNDYNAVGGMSRGQLGGINSIRPDYETDLIVEFAPFSTDTFYLKGFTGAEYTSKRWLSEAESDLFSYEYYDSYVNLENMYKYFLDYEYSAKAVLRLRNVGASVLCEYVPYYSEFHTVDPSIYDEEYCEYEFYPYLHEFSHDSYDKRDEEELANYLQIPEENIPVLKSIVKKEQIHGSTEEIIQQLTYFFAENYTYSMSPGKTPNKADFVNYFLEENKKGYCSHFASAAVLFLRYMGIPARYVEGYAIQPHNMSDGVLQNNLSYDDFYDGYNPLGETGVIRVDVDDSQAHAWVEYWDYNFGWRVAEFTPASDGSEDYSDFWDDFADMMSRNPLAGNTTALLDNSQNGQGLIDAQAFQNGVSTGLKIFKYGMLLLIVIFIIYHLTRFYCSYYSGDVCGNYMRIYNKIYGLARKKVPDFNTMHSHAEQLEIINDYMNKKKALPQDVQKKLPELAKKLEQLSYSNLPVESILSTSEDKEFKKILFTLWRILRAK